MSIVDRVKNAIRDVPDFPKKGIVFKDITPVLADIELSADVAKELTAYWSKVKIDGIVGIESRGFIYGMQMAHALKVPFYPVRKAGKLPHKTIGHAYDLEYGSARIEIHEDAISEGDNILIHDDLLATGGTAEAAAVLIKKSGGSIAGFSFLVELSFLNGVGKLKNFASEIHCLVSY